MEYQRDTEMSITPGLNPNVEQSRLEAQTILEQKIAQVIEKVHGKTTPVEHELVHPP